MISDQLQTRLSAYAKTGLENRHKLKANVRSAIKIVPSRLERPLTSVNRTLVSRDSSRITSCICMDESVAGPQPAASLAASAERITK